MSHSFPKTLGGLLLIYLLASCVTQPSDRGASYKQSVEDLVVYSDVVDTIFEQNCITCHNADDREGELNLETYEGLLKGGDSGYSIATGDKEDSELFLRITLPHDDADFMPAEDKPPLSEIEVAIIGWWIESGADLDLTVGATPGVPSEFSDYFQEIVDSMISPKELDRREKARHELYANIAGVQERTGALIIPLEPNASEFSVETFSVQKTFNDDSLSLLKPYAANIAEADFCNTQLTDQALEVLASFENLQVLNLSNTHIEGKNLGSLAELKHLKSLNLYGTPISSDSIQELLELTQLKSLYLFQTELYSEDALSQIREALPNCNLGGG